MKIIYNRFLPPGKFSAINIAGLIIARKDYGRLSEAEINHEQIHTRQIYEMFIIFFYVCYLLEWIARCIQYMNPKKAYMNISFEREAYSNMYNKTYLEKRKRFAFRKYFRM